MNEVGKYFLGLEEREILCAAYSELLDVVTQYLSKEEIAEVLRAAEYGARAHDGQKRKAGGPYFTHPLAVCGILATQRFDVPVLQAALLHDVLEDTPVSYEEMAAEFGEEVTRLVDGVTKLDHVKGLGKQHAQAETFRKFLLAITDDPRVIIVKLADRLHNMRTLAALPAAKRIAKARETLDVYAVIAGHLGLFYSRVQLEDLAFSYLYPLRYAVLQKHYMERFNRNEILAKVRETLTPELKNLGIRATIAKRQRHLWGLYQRMKRKGSFAAASQTVTIRVITDTIDNCYRALGALHSLYRPVKGKFEDYIAAPKPNGYRSLHSSVLMDNTLALNVQIRTQEMHMLAETGIIAVWHQHQKDQALTRETHNLEARARMHDWLSRLKDIQDITHDPLEFYEVIKKELAQGGIWVYSPQGEVMDLPPGATPVDFAYEIHSELGNECIGAQVNGLDWPLDKPLISGQTVKIIRRRGSSPNPSWLHFVQTARARTAICCYLNRQKSEEAQNLGRKLLTQALAQHGQQELDTMALAQCAQTQRQTPEQILEDIGRNRQQAGVLALAMIGLKTPPVLPEAEPTLFIESALDASLIFAPCCHPLPGDAIVGYTAAGRGIVIHRQNCRELHHQNCEALVVVAWKQPTRGRFPSALELLVSDRPQLLADLTAAISAAGSDILALQTFDPNELGTRIHLRLSLRDVDHRQQLIAQLGALNGVLDVNIP